MNIIKLMIPKIKVAYVSDRDTLRQGLEKMRGHGYTTVPVVTDDGIFVGTVSEGDCLWRIIDGGLKSMKELESVSISEVLSTKRNPAVKIDTGGEELYSRITECPFVPITDDRGCFVGIVTRRAVLSYYRERFFELSHSNQ